MLDHGIYKDRKAIIMSRLGKDLYEYIDEYFPNGYPYQLLCDAARYAV